MSHTPGPWAAVWELGAPFVGGTSRSRHNPRPVVVADLPAWGHMTPDEKEERDANAHLIASAPDLLKILNDIVSLVKMDKEANTVGTALWAAVGAAKEIIDRAGG